jgi:TonB family protein
MILSHKIRKRIRVTVLSTHFGLLLFLVLWYTFSKMQEHKERVIKVKLFQVPVPPTIKKDSSKKKNSSSVKKTAPVRKKVKSVKKTKTIKKTQKKKKNIKIKHKKTKKKVPVKRTVKSTAPKNVRKKSVPVKKSTKKTSKNKKRKKQYLRPEDIVISKKVISSEPQRSTPKLDIPAVAEREVEKKFLKNIKTPAGNYSISSKRKGGTISASYFNRVSGYIYRIWRQPTKAETGNRPRKVEIKVTVDSFGRVISARIIRKSQNSAMNRSVEELLKNMKTLPAPPDGKAVFSIELEVK